MSTINPHNVVWLLKQSFDETPLTKILDVEEELASYMKDIIEQAMTYGQTVVESVFDLVENGEVQNIIPIFDPEADDEEYRQDPESYHDIRDSRDVNFDYKKNAVRFWLGGASYKSNNRGRQQTQHVAFKTVQHRFRQVKHRETLYRWAKQVEAGGTHKEKLKSISEKTFAKFLAAKQDQLICHDLDIRKWALAAAREENCTSFKASLSWLRSFKKSHNIVSRKITKFVSRSDVQDREAIENAAVAFQLENSPILEKVGLENSYNTDQSGCNYETHAGRTLDISGERKVERVVQSKNSTTHSFTIMPTMSASGVLETPLYVVMREPKGQFGPQVKQSLFTSPNLKISCSESGKMGKKHLTEYISDVYIPTAGPESCLIVDSWSTFTEANMRAAIPADKKVTILQIPPGATGLIQPWDVWGFRIWKNYMKHLEDFVLLHDVDIVLSQRNNCLKMQALIHDQLRSPRYINFFKYSWFKAGLTGTRPDQFPNPVRFAFHGCEVECSEYECDNITMATCSWCKNALCVEHFFQNVHMCNNYIE